MRKSKHRKMNTQERMALLAQQVRVLAQEHCLPLKDLVHFLIYEQWKFEAREVTLLCARNPVAGTNPDDAFTFSPEDDIISRESGGEQTWEIEGKSLIEDVGEAGFAYDPDYKKPLLSPIEAHAAVETGKHKKEATCDAHA